MLTIYDESKVSEMNKTLFSYEAILCSGRKKESEM